MAWCRTAADTLGIWHVSQFYFFSSLSVTFSELLALPADRGHNLQKATKAGKGAIRYAQGMALLEENLETWKSWVLGLGLVV